MKISELLKLHAHPFRIVMGQLPINATPDLEETESISDDFTSLQESIKLFGVKEPLIVSNSHIVDGFMRLNAAYKVFGDNAEIPTIEIPEDDVFAHLMTNILNNRSMTKAQAIFSVYQIIREDHLAFIRYSEECRRINLKNSNASLVPQVPTSDEPTRYFDIYIGNSNLHKQGERPIDWFAKVLGVPRKYLVFLNEIWNYIEAEESLSYRDQMNQVIRSLIYINQTPLNRVISALEGAMSEREDLKPGQKEIYRKKWVQRCKSSVKGLAEKLNNDEFLADENCRKELSEALELAHFNEKSLEFLIPSLQRILRIEKSKNSSVKAA